MSDEKVYVLGLGEENQKIMDTLKARGISGVEFVNEPVNDDGLLFVLMYSEKERSLEIAKHENDTLTIAITQDETQDLPCYAVYDHENIDGIGSFIQGMSNLITSSGFVNIELDDVKTLMKDGGRIAFGCGIGEGEKKSAVAARKALENMKLSLKNSSSILMNITASPMIGLGELADAAGSLIDVIDPEAQIVWAHVIDESLGDSVKVSIYASHFSR